MMRPDCTNRILWCGVVLLAVATPVLGGSVKMRFFAPVLLVINFFVLLWLCRLNHGKAGSVRATPLDKPIFLFAALAAVSFFSSIYKQESFYALLGLLSFVGLYYLVVNNFDAIMARRAMFSFASAAGLLSGYGLLQYINILPHPAWVPQTFLASTYVNHNHFSGYLELVIPVTMALLLSAENGSSLKKLVLAGALAVMFAAFVFAQSRGAWLSLMTALFVMGISLLKRKNLKRAAWYVLFLPFSFALFLGFLNKMGASGTPSAGGAFERTEASSKARMLIWRGTVEMIRERPWRGIGLGTFEWGFSRFRPEGLNEKANFSHNDYLQMAAEMGLLAPLAMSAMVFVVIRRGLLNKDAPLEIVGCSAGVFSMALHGLVDFNFHIPANMLLCVVLLAFIMRDASCRREGKHA